MKTIIEPFRIKSIETLKLTTETERIEILKNANYNIFQIKAEDVIIDFLTDSGTAAMSSKQWAGIMDADESYAGAKSFFRFEKAVKDLTGFKNIIPTHQGRAAEKILFSNLGGKGKYFPNNTHFDTTRANIEATNSIATDFLNEDGKHPERITDFKGNIDLVSLEKYIIEKGAENIPLCLITITNNSNGGQPVSMQNIRETKSLLKKYNIPLFLDACRFAENAMFIKKREKGYENKTPKEIAQEMFSYADGCTMSAKKDAIVNMGGFLAMNDDELAKKCLNTLILTEGFPTYGGLSGRDLEAIAQGLEEVVDENYLTYRLRSIEYLGEKLTEKGIAIVLPTGGHGIYLDAKKILPHIPPSEFPGQSLVCALYEVGGIRSCEVGSVMFGKNDSDGNIISPSMELVRLAIPRRVYTQSHIDYVAEVIIEVYENRKNLKGYRFTYAPKELRHFTAKFEKII